ncbi:DNA polymerase V subunit UmuD, partial [Alcanivorax sp. HI0035]
MTALPFFTERVAAGFPSPAQGYLEAPLDLNQLCIGQQEATFLLRVEGDSMRDAGIFADDILVVDRSLEPAHGDVVVASLNGEFTVKELRLRPQPVLMPRNPCYAPIPLA